MDGGQFAGIFAERPTEWTAVLNPGAGIRDFTTTCTCRPPTCKHALTMQYLCIVHTLVRAHVCTMLLYTSTCPVASLKLLLQPPTVRKALKTKKHYDVGNCK